MPAWSGVRQFTVVDRRNEAANIDSFFLKPVDGGEVQGYLPGQYLRFRVKPASEPKPGIATYSLSDRPGLDHYRITIKRLPGGRFSGHFHEAVHAGTVLDVAAPNGVFFLDAAETAPVVLISAGVGLTPLVSMRNALTAAGTGRECWFLHSARSAAEHAFRGERPEGVETRVFYSNPGVGDTGFDVRGRLTPAAAEAVLPAGLYESAIFYICGPVEFLCDHYQALRARGVSKERARYEFFGTTVALD
ncbi:MAG: hypothetical protein FJW40_22055 [Acidobacteria bacterium]|nr:hypothetical protein [Acidobacteriota bacterium]